MTRCSAAHKQLGDRISGGVVITKYDHAQGPIGPLTIWEAGHPVPDENSYRATQAAIEVVSGLRENDMVLFLLSGGGSALFEKPLIPPEELEDITRQLLASIAQYHADTAESLAFIFGGETVVHLTGQGLGGRNQELALSAARGIAGLENTLIFSLGSDGTDGPTDAAGGLVDGTSLAHLQAQGIQVDAALQNNDAYHALKAIGGLIITGPTGTNVNDLSVLLMKRP